MSRLDNCLTAIVGDKLPIETARKTFFFLLGIAVMLIVIALPSPSPFYKGEEAIPLTANAKIVMAVLCFAVIQWMTEAIPFPATSLCLIVFLHILGVASFDKLVTLGFGNNVLLFLMGAMGLSAAMTSSGLARRFMLWMLTKVGRRTDRIVLAFIAIGTMTSMWVTDMAVAAMLLPLGVSILESSGCKPLQSNFGRALMIGIVWGALIGGTATPAGCGPNVLAMQYVRDMAHMDVSFAQWMAVGVPGAMIMVPLGWFCLMKLVPPEFREIPTSLESIRAELNALGGLNTKEIRTLVVFLTMVTLWLGGSNLEPYIGFKAPEGFVALLGFVLLFGPGLRKVGAPEDLIQVLEDPSREAITELMKVSDLIVATGSGQVVRAAYSSGTPAYGVGQGNACAIVAEDADVAEAAKMICGSKLFDYATSCSSENAVIPVEAVYDQFMAEMKKNGCYLVTGEDREKLKNHMWKPNAKGKIALNPDIIAKSAQVIADGAGISIPEGTDILLVEGMEPILGDKFHDEKISPVLTVYKAKDFKDAYRILVELTNLVGRGHSCGIHTYKHEYIEFLGEHMKSSRITVRQSMSAGNGGHPFNRMPSTATLGCGTWGGNSTTENVHWRHFINVTWVNEPVAPWTFTDEDMWGDFWKKYGK